MKHLTLSVLLVTLTSIFGQAQSLYEGMAYVSAAADTKSTVSPTDQTQDYLLAPKPGEKVLGSITIEQFTDSEGVHNWATAHRWYIELYNKASRQYPNRNIDIRQMIPAVDDHSNLPWKAPIIAKVVELYSSDSPEPPQNTQAPQTPQKQLLDNLSKAMDKAFRSVREGSRVAIDMVTVTGNEVIKRDDLKDNIIDALLDRGYKVVAKEYLEKLYEEQQTQQQAGIFNEKTTVQENNFSAVGYFINVKVSETSLRVQVVNVSTGEYEGNSTIML